MSHIFWYVMILILTSLVGLSYFAYGKKESDIWFMADGAALMVYPYVVGGLLMMAVIGAVLIAAPFAVRRYL